MEPVLPKLHAGPVDAPPPVVQLSDPDKFRLPSGAVVEVRGHLDDPSMLYFRETHIGELLGMTNVQEVLLACHEGLERVELPVTCFSPHTHRKEEVTSHIAFLTTHGVVRLVYDSCVPRADEFRRWARRVLGVTIAGDQVHRKLLASSIAIGVNLAHIADAAGIYGLALGLVGDLREGLGIPATYPNSWYVVKYGCTTSMHDGLLKRHLPVYGKIPGASLMLWVFKGIQRMPLESMGGFKAVLREQKGELAQRLEEFCVPWKGKGQERRELMLVPNLRFLSLVYNEVAQACVTERDSAVEELLCGCRERALAAEHNAEVLAAKLATAQAVMRIALASRQTARLTSS